MMRGMRALLGVCLFVVAGLIALSTFSSGPPTTTTLHSLVAQTHDKLNQLHKLKEELGGDQPLDNTLLTELGFVDKPILFPNHLWSNISSPVIVSAITSRFVEFVPELVKVAQILSPNASLMIYALDLTEEDLKEIGNECNESCNIIQFDFSHYPYHLQDLRLGAYRSIIIQEMLERAGIVFWIDPCMHLLRNNSSESLPNERSLLDQWVSHAMKTSGVLAWPLLSPAPHLPTAALSHPDMFPAFRTFKHNYDFQQMSDPKAILIINTAIIHQRLMRPWVRCALIASCLSPIGAQDTGCKYNKKPLFRYSGCHLYDTSAFNVALGLTFGMDNDSYLDTSPKFICLTKNHLQTSYASSNSGHIPSLSGPSISTSFGGLDGSTHLSSHRKLVNTTSIKYFENRLRRKAISPYTNDIDNNSSNTNKFKSSLGSDSNTRFRRTRSSHLSTAGSKENNLR